MVKFLVPLIPFIYGVWVIVGAIKKWEPFTGPEKPSDNVEDLKYLNTRKLLGAGAVQYYYVLWGVILILVSGILFLNLL